MANMAAKFYALVDQNTIYDLLFDHCSPASIYRVARTCHLARSAVKDYTSHAFDINRNLNRFFSYPVSFRVLQARTEAVVSGSFALQFMDRTIYPNSDLDIFVANRNAAEVCSWIVNHGGRQYQFVPTERQIENGILDVDTILEGHSRTEGYTYKMDTSPPAPGPIWDFYSVERMRAVVNFASTDEKSRRVQVIVTHNTPMECILCFHSTVVMNIITHFAAYSLFPKGTFEEGLMLPFDTREVNREFGIEKYLARGWERALSAAPPFSEPKGRMFVLGKRCVGDQSTWMIPLPGVSNILKYAQVKDHPPDIDPITLNTFSLVSNAERESIEMAYFILKPHFLKGRYTACPESYAKIEFWLKWIRNVQNVTGASGDIEKQMQILWASILKRWNAGLMRYCDCISGNTGNRYQLRACPAFISSFAYFNLVARQLLINANI